MSFCHLTLRHKQWVNWPLHKLCANMSPTAQRYAFGWGLEAPSGTSNGLLYYWLNWHVLSPLDSEQCFIFIVNLSHSNSRLILYTGEITGGLYCRTMVPPAGNNTEHSCRQWGQKTTYNYWCPDLVHRPNVCFFLCVSIGAIEKWLSSAQGSTGGMLATRRRLKIGYFGLFEMNMKHN